MILVFFTLCRRVLVVVTVSSASSSLMILIMVMIDFTIAHFFLLQDCEKDVDVEFSGHLLRCRNSVVIRTFFRGPRKEIWASSVFVVQ